MKICIIAPSVIPILGKNQKYGGIELFVAVMTEKLVERGHEVVLFASGDSKTKAKLVPVTRKALGVGVAFEKERKANNLAYAMAIDENPDVIWDHTIAIHSHIKGIDRSKYIYQVDFSVDKKQLIDTGNIPVIHTLHGPARDHLPKIMKSLSECGHYFVGISHDQTMSYRPHIAYGQLLGTVHNSIDLDHYPLKEDSKDKYLLWVGRYCMEKGPHIAIEVAKKMNMPIKMMGKLVEKHEKEYFNKFIKPKLRKKDEIIKHTVSQSKKAELFRNAFATIMPNLWSEPFGLVALESMASGTPVVAPSKGALPEILGNLGVIVPVNDLGLSETVTKFTSPQREYIQRMAKLLPKAGRFKPLDIRERVEKNFSLDNCAKKYEQMFFNAIQLNHMNELKRLPKKLYLKKYKTE